MNDHTVLESIRNHLAIDCSQKSLDHFRILGLQPFRVSVEEVERAAERQLDRLSKAANSDVNYPRIVELIETARDCLVDQERKDAYVREMQKTLLMAPATRATMQEHDRKPADPAPPEFDTPLDRAPAASPEVNVEDAGEEGPVLSNLEGDLEPEDDSRPEEDTSHPNYEVLQEIGRGASSVVYEAYDRTLRRYVAIKQYERGGGAQGSESDMFWQEARFLAGLQHENIVRVHAVDQQRSWIIMELMKGDLRTRLAAGLSPELVRSVLRQALQGLCFLHQRGVLHGEVKSGNLLIDTEGLIKLSDSPGFSMDAEFRLPFGSQCHVAPELLKPGEFGPVGPGVDLYPLGFVALEMMTAGEIESAFKGISRDPQQRTMGWLRWHGSATEQVPPIQELLPDAPSDLKRVIDGLTRKRVEDRYQSAIDALEDLAPEPVLALDVAESPNRNGQPMAPLRTPFVAHRAATSETAETGNTATGAKGKKRKLIWGAAAGGLLLLLFLMFAIMSRPRTTPEPTPEAGVLRIASDPSGAKVRIDGSLVDKLTPVEVPLESRRYNLVVTAEHHAPYTSTVEVPADGIVNHFAQLAPLTPNKRTVAIYTDPSGAEISLAGKTTGLVTPAELELETGMHEIGLEADGFRPVREVVVIEESTRTLDWKLDSIQYSVQIVCTPGNARITLDGIELEETAPLSRILSPGRHVARARLDGYEPLEQEFVVSDPNEVVSLVLTPSEVDVTIKSEPSGVPIALSGRSIGKTPATLRLRLGDYDVTLGEVPGYEGLSERIRVDRQQRSFRFALAKSQQRQHRLDELLRVARQPTVFDVIGNHLNPRDKQRFVWQLNQMLTSNWGALDPQLRAQEKHLRSQTQRDPRLNYSMGLIYQKHGQVTEAIAAYDRAADIGQAAYPAPWHDGIILRLQRSRPTDTAESIARSVRLVMGSSKLAQHQQSSLNERALAVNAEFVGKVFGLLSSLNDAKLRKVSLESEEDMIHAYLTSPELKHDYWTVYTSAKSEVRGEFEGRRSEEDAEEELRKQAANAKKKKVAQAEREIRSTLGNHVPRKNSSKFFDDVDAVEEETPRIHRKRAERTKDTGSNLEMKRTYDADYRREIRRSSDVGTYFSTNLETKRLHLESTFPDRYTKAVPPTSEMVSFRAR